MNVDVKATQSLGKLWANKRRLVPVAAAACLLIAAVAYWLYDQSRAIVVGQYSISRSVNQQMQAEFSEQFSGEYVYSEYVIEALKLRVVADRFGIKQDTAKIKAAAIREFGLNGKEQPTALQLLVAERMLYEAAVELKTHKTNRLAYIEVPFSLRFAYDINNATDEVVEGFGDPQSIEKDKLEARDKAEVYRQTLLKSRSESEVDSVLQQVKSDKRFQLGFDINASRLFHQTSKGVVVDDNGLIDLSRVSLDDQILIDYLGSSGVTEIQVRKASGVSEIDGYSGPDVPVAYYFFVKLRSEPGDPSLQGKIKQAKESIKVESRA